MRSFTVILPFLPLFLMVVAASSSAASHGTSLWKSLSWQFVSRGVFGYQRSCHSVRLTRYPEKQNRFVSLNIAAIRDFSFYRADPLDVLKSWVNQAGNDCPYRSEISLDTDLSQLSSSLCGACSLQAQDESIAYLMITDTGVYIILNGNHPEWFPCRDGCLQFLHATNWPNKQKRFQKMLRLGQILSQARLSLKKKLVLSSPDGSLDWNICHINSKMSSMNWRAISICNLTSSILRKIRRKKAIQT